MARQRANMSDLLKENQKYDQIGEQTVAEREEKDSNTTLTQNDNPSIPQSGKTVLEQNSNTPLLQRSNTLTHQNITVSQPKKHTSADKAKSDNTINPQEDKASMSQSINTPIPQNNNTSLLPNERMTDKRDRVTFYLDPGQLERLEELKIEYRKKTGTRINEQEIVRRVIDRLTLDFLL